MVYKNDIMSRYFEHAGYLSQKKKITIQNYKYNYKYL